MGFYANHSLVDDAKRHGVQVRAVHPNESVWESQVCGAELCLGFGVVEGLGQAKTERLLQERARRPFQDLNDFVLRGGLGTQVLQRLALGDAFRCFGLEQREALWQVLDLQALAARSQGPQLGLWDQLSVAHNPSRFKGLNAYQSVAADYQAFGLSTRAHPMQALRGLIKLPKALCADARQAPHNSFFSTSGLLIVRQRPGEGKVIFATLEDESGLLDMVLFMDVYEKFRDLFLNHAFFKAGGILQRDQDSMSLLLKDLQALKLEEALKVGSHDWR